MTEAQGHIIIALFFVLIAIQSHSIKASLYFSIGACVFFGLGIMQSLSRFLH
jgi:hypothetical protein